MHASVLLNLKKNCWGILVNKIHPHPPSPPPRKLLKLKSPFLFIYYFIFGKSQIGWLLIRLHLFHISCVFFVVMTSECCVKRVICKTWTRLSAVTLGNNADPDQTPHNAESDQGLLVCLNYRKLSVNEKVLLLVPILPTLTDNRPASVVSALI